MSGATFDLLFKAKVEPSGFDDAKGRIRDVSNYTESLRKNSLFRENRAQAAGLLNLSRQGADIFSQGITGTSPFTILVQQGPQILDILASGAVSAGMFAKALGGMGIGIAGIMGAVTSYQKMAEAIDDAATSQDRLNKSTLEGLKLSGKIGIAPNEEQRGLDFFKAQKAEFEQKRSELYEKAVEDARLIFKARMDEFNRVGIGSGTRTGPMPELSAIYEEQKAKESFKKLSEVFDAIIAEAESNIADIQSLSGLGGLRLFNEKISKEARQAIEQRGIESTAEMVSTSQLKFMQEALASGLKKADAMQATPEKANLLNSLQYLSEWLTKLGAAVEKVQDSRMGMARDELDRFFGDIDSASKENARSKPSQLSALKSAQVSARQAIGGMANAPILSSYQKQTDYLAKIAETSRMTAQNTAKTTLPAAPVSTAN